MLRELFTDILDHYITDQKKFNNSEKPRRLSNYTSFSALTNDLPSAITALATIDDAYKVKGSAGNGNIAEVPHICVFDRSITESAQNGYYIVYLFDAEMSAVYLSLNQGWTEYEKLYGVQNGRNQVKVNTDAARTYLRSTFSFNSNSIDLKSNNSLGKGYELANICSKQYLAGAIPSDKELINDLRNLMGVYRELKGLVGHSILNIVASLTEDDYQNSLQIPPPDAEESDGPVEKKDLRDRSASLAYPRDPVVAARALKKANYQCENDPGHLTFYTASDHQFMEAHHLIPLAFQNCFDNSLDIVSNIICLCPNCHRAFHLAPTAFKNKLIEKFFANRLAQLEEQGISIKIDQLQKYYKLDEVMLLTGIVA